jgi:hypothetical protein
MRRPSPRAVAALQSAYYFSTAVSPFVSRRGFEAVTGPKEDWWLVKTVGVLTGVIGAALAVAASGNVETAETRVLGAGAAVALGTIDVVYVARKRISAVYLIDAGIEFALLAGWMLHQPARPG